MSSFPGRLALQQRVLPAYRAPFFDALAEACEGGLSVFAGEARPSESIKTMTGLKIARYAPADNQHLLAGSLYLCRQPGFLDWLETWQPDALIVEANPRYLSTPAAIRWMHQRERPVLGWALGAPRLTGPFSGVRQRARHRLIHSLDGIISYSQRGAEEYRALGLPAERVFVAHNAAARVPAAPPTERPKRFDRPPTILFVGRLQARKRLDNLFRACAALAEAPKLVIVGDGPARVEFERQAQDLYPAAEFVGAKHGAALEDYYAQADIFVLPGTGGLAVQQAMAYGLPVIVAQGDGTQDDLVRPGNGWLIRPDDLDDLSNTLRQALADPARLRGMGNESYRIVRDEINLEKMLAAFVNALNQIAAVRG